MPEKELALLIEEKNLLQFKCNVAVVGTNMLVPITSMYLFSNDNTNDLIQIVKN